MAERRSLTAGLEDIGGVDPETARAFIAQEKPTPKVKPSPVQVVPQPTAVENAEPPDAIHVASRVPASPAKRPAKSMALKRPDTSRLLANLLVPVTVRLRPEIASALKRASLERQLNGFETFTQQDIVEDALVPWLKSEGLLE